MQKIFLWMLMGRWVNEDTFAFADGLNVLEMLEFVQNGIAMGNAQETVKNAAYDIINTHDEDDIYNSFEKYGLI